jgi:hypothetical protein
MHPDGVANFIKSISSVPDRGLHPNQVLTERGFVNVFMRKLCESVNNGPWKILLDYNLFTFLRFVT